MDAALLETGWVGGKSQEEETTEHPFGKQKTCKRLIMALINDPPLRAGAKGAWVSRAIPGKS